MKRLVFTICIVALALIFGQPLFAQEDLTARLAVLADQHDDHAVLELIESLPPEKHNSAVSYYKLESLLNFNRMAEIRKIVEATKAKKEKDVYDHLAIAKWALHNEDYRTAWEQSKLSQEANPEIVDAKILRLRLLRHQADTFRDSFALSSFSILAKDFRDDHPTIDREYIMNFSAWPTKRRIKELTEFSKNNPKDAIAHKYLGFLYNFDDNATEAVKHLDKAAALRPRHGNIYVVRADSHVRLKEFESALKDYDRAVELEPSGISYQARGFFHLLQKDVEAALKDFIQAFKTDPITPRIQDTSLIVLLRTENDESALKFVDAMIATEPDRWYHYFNKCRVLASMDQFDESIQAIDKAAELGNDFQKIQCRARRALVFSNFDKHEEAVDQIKALSEKHPDNKQIANMMNQILAYQAAKAAPEAKEVAKEKSGG